MNRKNLSVKLSHIFNGANDILQVYLKFRSNLKKFKKKSYVVAVSGGPDSLALTALTSFYNFENDIKFRYVLINHNIRNNSTKEAQQVKVLLKKNGINLEILKNEKKITKNIQGKARVIRYEKLYDYCKKSKINTILTGHNLEDQVETFLIRLSRGSGLVGLSAMKAESKLKGNINLCRPLLDIKKSLLIKITKLVFGKFIKDPSNKNNRYFRTKLRKLKSELKKSGLHYEQIARSINNLASSKATLDEYFEKIYKEIVKKNKKNIFLNLKKFEELNEELKIRIINISIKLIKGNYYNPRSKKVVNLIKNIKKRAFRKSTLGGCLFIRENNRLWVKLEKN